MSHKVAVVTMVYNESVFLPLWLKYYSQQFGSAHCYVVDHGSVDGTTDRGVCPANVLRIPRSPQHDKKRSEFLSNFCSSLLEWYDTVIYTDVDEFLIADPLDYSDLQDFCARRSHPTISAIGFNVTHRTEVEPIIDLDKPILVQRPHVRFEFAMCKPLVTSVPIRWVPGFHYSDQPLRFDRLFLFHLRNFDLNDGLRRLQTTRSIEWGDAGPDHYARWSDERVTAMAVAIGRMSVVSHSTFMADDPNIKPHIDAVTDFVEKNPQQASNFYAIFGSVNEFLRIPDRFLSAF